MAVLEGWCSDFPLRAVVPCEKMAMFGGTSLLPGGTVERALDVAPIDLRSNSMFMSPS